MGGSASAGDVDGTSIQGGTDGTTIGNTSTKMHVESYAPLTGTPMPCWSKSLRYVDMNVASGGVARQANIATSATWTTVFLYSGSGALASFLLTLETATGWEMQLTVDSELIFSFPIEDLTNAQIYGLDSETSVPSGFIGMSESGDRFTWHPSLSYPMRYLTSILVEVRRPTSGAKKFRAGLIILSKDT